MTSRRVTSRIAVPTLIVASLLMLAATRAQAAFTDHFDALAQELALRAVTLGGSTDKTELKQAKACVKALATIGKSTTSLATDIKAAGKVAKTLQKAFPNEFTPLAAKGAITPAGAVTNLEDLLIDVFVALGADIQDAIDALQTQIDALPAGSDKDKAQAALDAAQALLDEAAVTGDFAAAAKLGASALKAVLKGVKIVEGADGGGGGGSNSVTMKVDGSSWNSAGADGTYTTGTGALLIGAASTNPPSQLTIVVSSGITGPGTYPLAPSSVTYLEGFNAYVNTGGTITVTSLNVGPTTTSITATFEFMATGLGGTINVTQGTINLSALLNQ